MNRKSSENRSSQKRMARTSSRSLPVSDFYPFPSGRPLDRGSSIRYRPSSKASSVSSLPMVPEIDLSSDSDDDHELELLKRPSQSILFPSGAAPQRISTGKQLTDTPNKSTDTKPQYNLNDISPYEASSIHSSIHPLIPELDLSSDSEDELELEILTRKILNPKKEAFTLPKITKSKIHRELEGKKYFKIIYHKSPNRWFREWVSIFYIAYLDIYTHCNRKFSLVGQIFWLYGLASYWTALGIHLMEMLSNTWRLSLRYALRIILRTDEVITTYLDDRHAQLFKPEDHIS